MQQNTATEKTRDSNQLWEHYVIERELADRLRCATAKERTTLYNMVYEERNRRIPHHPLVVRANDRQAQIRAAVPQLRLLRAFVNSETVFLEVGAGDAALATELAKHVGKVYVTDVTTTLIGDIEWPVNAEFRITNGISVPVPPASIDLVYSNQVMEHLHPEDAHEQLQNIYGVLRPGGQYICITPNRLSGPHDISAHFDEVATGFHLKEYTIVELARVLNKAGFSRVNVFLSYKGHILSPILPILPFTLVEWAIARLPRAVRRKVGYLLVAAKMIATK